MPPISPTVLAALLGAIAGAIVSAILTNVVRAAIERRAKRRESREVLAAEAVAVVADTIADLGLWSSSLRVQDSPGEHEKARSAFTRATGRLTKLQLHAWRLFPEWYVRRAMTQLAGRVRTVAAKVDEDNFTSHDELQMALEWLHEAEASVTEHLADAAGVQTSHRQQFGFLGFKRAVRERREELARMRDAEPAPWTSTLEVELNDLNASPESKRQIHATNFPKISGLRCPVHKRAPHVKLIGSSRSFTIQVEGCCERLSNAAHDALAKGSASEA